MENATVEEKEEASVTRKSRRPASAKKVKRGGTSSKSGRSSATTELMKRGRILTTEAQRWVGNASRMAAPITDLSSNAMVIGALGLGVGVAIGALLPRMPLPALPRSSPQRTPAANSGTKKRRKK